MKSFLAIALLLSSTLLGYSQTNSSFHDFQVRTILGDTISLSEFEGKKILVVNTASFCSYTYQYGLLESLREQYSTDYNFEIIGFPCNDFGNQEPGHDSTILEFCTNTYNVQFPMMSAIHIRTGDTAAVYKWLQRGELNGVSDAIVDWNFNKFLIDEQGNWVNHFISTVSPFDSTIVNWITDGSVSTNLKTNTDELIQISNFSNQSLLLKYKGIPATGTLSLFSIDGRFVQSFPIQLTTGTQLLSMQDFSNSSGLYLARIEISGKHKLHKIVTIIPE
jgi:glutathione peroxidase